MAQIKAAVNVGPRIGQYQGFTDGGHVYLKCSGCGKGLVDVWVTKPEEIDPSTGKPFVWDVMAHCCYCGDHSFKQVIHGGFHPSGFGETDPNDSEVAILQTVIDHIEDDDKGVIHFYTEKAPK